MSATLVHHRQGEGEPLVLIHGIGSRWQVWGPVLDELAQHFDVIAIDLPGFGESPIRGSAVDVYRLTDAVVDFCAQIGVERPHVAGNSMGGAIALEMGKRGIARSVTAFSPIGFWHRIGRVWCQTVLRTMRLIGGALRPALPTLVRSAVARILLFSVFFGKPGRLDPSVALADVDGLLHAPNFDQALRAFGEYHLDGRGALRNIPVTIAWGNRDVLLTYATQSRRARRQLPNAQHITLPGCGHVPFSDSPERCASVLLANAGDR